MTDDEFFAECKPTPAAGEPKPLDDPDNIDEDQWFAKFLERKQADARRTGCGQCNEP